MSSKATGQSRKLFIRRKKNRGSENLRAWKSRTAQQKASINDGHSVKAIIPEVEGISYIFSVNGEIKLKHTHSMSNTSDRKTYKVHGGKVVSSRQKKRSTRHLQTYWRANKLLNSHGLVAEVSSQDQVTAGPSRSPIIEGALHEVLNKAVLSDDNEIYKRSFPSESIANQSQDKVESNTAATKERLPEVSTTPIAKPRSSGNEYYEKVMAEVYSCKKCRFKSFEKTDMHEHIKIHKKVKKSTRILAHTGKKGTHRNMVDDSCCCETIDSLHVLMADMLLELESQKKEIEKLIAASETFHASEIIPIQLKESFHEIQRTFYADPSFNRSIVKWLLFRCDGKRKYFVHTVLSLLFTSKLFPFISWSGSYGCIKLSKSWVHRVLMEVNYLAAFWYTEKQIQQLVQEEIASQCLP